MKDGQQYTITPCDASTAVYTIAERGKLKFVGIESDEVQVASISSMLGFQPEHILLEYSKKTYQRWCFLFAAENREPTYCEIYFYRKDWITSGDHNAFCILFPSTKANEIVFLNSS